MKTLGLVLAVLVTPASVQHRAGRILLLARERDNWPKLRRVYADGGYPGALEEKVAVLDDWLPGIVRGSDEAKGYERLKETSEGFITRLVKWRRLKTEEDDNLEIDAGNLSVFRPLHVLSASKTGNQITLAIEEGEAMDPAFSVGLRYEASDPSVPYDETLPVPVDGTVSSTKSNGIGTYDLPIPSGSFSANKAEANSSGSYIATVIVEDKLTGRLATVTVYLSEP